MTQITINKPPVRGSNEHPISDVSVGTWYIVTKYPHNPCLIGEVGVGFSDYDSRGIVTPSGDFYCNEEFVVKPLLSVEISYKE